MLPITQMEKLRPPEVKSLAQGPHPPASGSWLPGCPDGFAQEPLSQHSTFPVWGEWDQIPAQLLWERKRGRKVILSFFHEAPLPPAAS